MCGQRKCVKVSGRQVTAEMNFDEQPLMTDCAVEKPKKVSQQEGLLLFVS